MMAPQLTGVEQFATGDVADRGPPEAARIGLSFQANCLLAWAVAMGFLLVGNLVTQRQWAAVLRTAQPVDPGRCRLDFGELKRRAGVSQSVPLLSCPQLSSPAVAGLLRPRVILPPALIKVLSTDQLRWVLLHELAHIRRRDLWLATFQQLVQIAHFFNPAVWAANWLVNRQREYVCDVAALAGSDVSRRQCGEAFCPFWSRHIIVPRPVHGL